MLYVNYLHVVSENLRLLRRLFGFSQSAVSSALGISRPTYCEVESGKTVLSLYCAILASGFYGVSLDLLADPALCDRIFTSVSEG